MSRLIVLSEIRNLIESLAEQQSQIEKHTGAIPRIETDIMMGNVRKLYEMLHLISKEEAVPQKMELQPEIVKQEPVFEQPVIAEKIESISKVLVVEAEASFENRAEQAMVTATQAVTEQEPLLEEVSAQTDIHIQPETLLIPVDQEVSAPVTEIHHEEVLPRAAVSATRKKSFMATASLFDESPSVGAGIIAQPTVYDKISSASEDSSISRRMQSDPVSDLKKSIGINEKFSFINELFDGDLDSYNRAIDQLNSCDNLEPATLLLRNTFTVQYGWNTQSNAYLNLTRLVERRYSR
jgi:hypothetical protein